MDTVYVLSCLRTDTRDQKYCELNLGVLAIGESPRVLIDWLAGRWEIPEAFFEGTTETGSPYWSDGKFNFTTGHWTYKFSIISHTILKQLIP